MSIEHNTTLPFTFPTQAGNANDSQPRVQLPGGRRSVQFAAKGSAFEVASGVTNVITKKSKSLVPPSPVQFRPIDTDPKPTIRSKFNDMGSVLALTRDNVKCVVASLLAQLPPETCKQLGIERAFAEMGEVIAGARSRSRRSRTSRRVLRRPSRPGCTILTSTSRSS